MELISIIIMLLGIAVLVALYFMSRQAKNHLPQEKEVNIHAVRDDDGRLATSVQDDIPGTDTPSNVEYLDRHRQKPRQFALFIASRDPKGLEGNYLLSVFEQLGLEHGEMNLFHRMILTDNGEVSLYKIANGVEPWTLNPDEIRDTYTPGLSAVLDLPSIVDDEEAIEDFVAICQKIAEAMNADLKNDQQALFSEHDKQQMIASIR
ncbi:MAG: cell division protein ZipA C-terminal FtsZ-binding domain-containing protein [bacterium]